ncbi:LuxR C-terminal-related transcriptional regulator [Picosynechococcus sp. NKBG15041c]|uniref:LuxR C-terminal-related transcriptional regulator n=1 Tax=Picosynechococcus sp. NKBG15041c TaxID=1407650 RepID=UPI0028F440E3|nr:LuxR C-terminal-related transcriptional regulator [Picosynechococcus sp. NKBG15041c]
MDLQRVHRITQGISGCLEPALIAKRLTEALIGDFNCAFARIWLTEPDRQSLRLVASSGLSENINGSFAWVPMGAYKVGKIAKNGIPFLSNQLAEEAWVKDRDWAIANRIQGFAGYPLVSQKRIIGVLAAFSHETFLPEFLEVLQVLCMAGAIALDAAQRKPQAPNKGQIGESYPLSDHLSSFLTTSQLSLIGTERPLTPSLTYLLIKTVEILNQFNCHYCRLTYGDTEICLEGIIAASTLTKKIGRSPFADIEFFVQTLGGQCNVGIDSQEAAHQISLTLPYGATTQAHTSKDSLSQRERQILILLTTGLRDRDIAQQLHISESTVKFHLNRTLSKLQAKNRYQAIYQATKQGLI